MTFIFHREPRERQRWAFERTKDAEYALLNMEPRTGKTQVALDTFRHRYAMGHVDALVVIAYPNGVQHVWISEALQVFPPNFMPAENALGWSSGKMGSKLTGDRLAALLRADGPKLIALNCEAILTDTAWKFLQKFFARNRVMLVADEDWATRWTARTKRLLAMGRGRTTMVRRLLTGTPCDEGPFDFYYPTTFLKPGCLGFTSMSAFRNHFAEYDPTPGYNRKTGIEYKKLLGYRHLDELRRRLSPFTVTVKRAEMTDAPPKVYAYRHFDLTPKQRRVYDRLRDEYVAELQHTTMPVAHVLTRLLRLQQVARNWLPTDAAASTCDACGGGGCGACGGIGMVVPERRLERIDHEHNPAVGALVEEVRATRGPAIVWCRFKQDVKDCVGAVAAHLGVSVTRYDGDTPEEERQKAYDGFRAGTIDVIVSTDSSGLTRGHDLSRAKALIYYSQGYSRRNRTQTEDRAEALHKSAGTDVIDLVAVGTRDVDVVDILRSKRELADVIMGNPTGWL